jgi:hypothetical protein
MPFDATPQPTMIERVERALVLLAYFIEDEGDKYLPIYEHLERELEKLRANADTRSRARQRLLAYSERGALNAIR